MPYRTGAFREGGVYHVYNRGASRLTIFPDDDNFEYFIRLLHHHADKRHIGIMCYCLMPNHFHMLVRQGADTTISNMMQGLCSAYTQALNRRIERKGTLFEGRFKFREVCDDADLVQLMRYIHLNPVRAHLSSHAREWQASDCNAWLLRVPRNRIRSSEFERVQGYRRIFGLPSAEEYGTLLASLELPESQGHSGS